MQWFTNLVMYNFGYQLLPQVASPFLSLRADYLQQGYSPLPRVYTAHCKVVVSGSGADSQLVVCTDVELCKLHRVWRQINTLAVNQLYCTVYIGLNWCNTSAYIHVYVRTILCTTKYFVRARACVSCD